MSCLLYKLRFLSPVHFGQGARSLESSSEGACADVLFSALCHTALSCEGMDGLKALKESAENGKLFISDLMPYKDDELFIPKPCIIAEKSGQALAADAKDMKKLCWIPLSRLDDFLLYVRGKKTLKANELSCEFGLEHNEIRVSLQNVEKSEPYSVSSFSFNDGCGLYTIIECDSELSEKLSIYFNLLGLSGIGGKISSGLGKFQVEACVEISNEPRLGRLCAMLSALDADNMILLNASLPKDDELDFCLENASYTIVRRGGFVQSTSYSATPGKKSEQYFFAAGSVFKKRFSGDVYDVSINGRHPVYRYSKAMFLGVNDE